jgi:hypothetical protein
MGFQPIFATIQHLAMFLQALNSHEPILNLKCPFITYQRDIMYDPFMRYKCCSAP